MLFSSETLCSYKFLNYLTGSQLLYTHSVKRLRDKLVSSSTSELWQLFTFRKVFNCVMPFWGQYVLNFTWSSVYLVFYLLHVHLLQYFVISIWWSHNLSIILTAAWSWLLLFFYIVISFICYLFWHRSFIAAVVFYSTLARDKWDRVEISQNMLAPPHVWACSKSGVSHRCLSSMFFIFICFWG